MDGSTEWLTKWDTEQPNKWPTDHPNDWSTRQPTDQTPTDPSKPNWTTNPPSSRTIDRGTDRSNKHLNNPLTYRLPEWPSKPTDQTNDTPTVPPNSRTTDRRTYQSMEQPTNIRPTNQPTNRGYNPSRKKHFSLFQIEQTGPMLRGSAFLFLDWSGQGVKLTTDVLLVLRSESTLHSTVIPLGVGTATRYGLDCLRIDYQCGH